MFWLFLAFHVLTHTLEVFGKQSCTKCGYTPTGSSPCCDKCRYFDQSRNICVPSCGKACKTDSDCGNLPTSDCSACVGGTCRAIVDFSNCTQQNPRQEGQPQAPILPQAWKANFNVYNYLDPSDFGTGMIWYDARFGGLRNDFYSRCPFVELNVGFDNDVPCTVLFYKGYNYYIYPSQNVCCGYHFPSWRPDNYQVANASLGGTEQINGKLVDYWRFQYTCPWIRPSIPITKDRLPAYTVQRDIYFLHGTNIPARMNETLTSAYTDFFNVQIGPQDETVFSSFLSQYNCLSGKDKDFLKTCDYYNAQGRSVYLGFS